MSTENLEQYTGKKVLVTVKAEDGTFTEVEGTVEVGTPDGVLIKPKGKTKIDLIEAASIEEIKYVAEAPKAITAKKLKLVTFGQARGHLLERHGYKLADINGMTEQAAFDFHAGLDHKALDLGHVHEDKAETPAGAAVAAAEADAS